MSYAMSQARSQTKSHAMRHRATWLLMRKEFLSIVRDGRLLAAALSMLLLLGGVFYAAGQEHRQRLAERAVTEEKVRHQWDHQGEKGAHAGAHFGLYAFTPQSALTTLEPGIRRYSGQAIWLEPHKRNLARFGDASDQGPAQRLGEMTAGFVLYALMPLIVLALAFGAVSGEREQGTLRMLHSLGLNGRQLLLSKLAGITAGFVLVVLPALVLGLLLLGAGQSMDAQGVPRFGMLLLALLLYYGIFAALALAVSAWMPGSRTALLVLLAVWLAGVVVAPRVASGVVHAATPLPTADAFWAAVRHDIANGLGNDGKSADRLAKFEADTLAKYQVSKLEDLPLGFPALRRNFNDAYSKKVHDRHFNALYERLERQKDQTLAASVFGPAPAMRLLSMSLAGTDLYHQRHFENAAEAYRRHFINLSDEWDMQRTRGTTGGGKAGNVDWQSVPAYAYQPPGAWAALQSGAWALALVLGWLALALVLMLASARKIKP